jgi:thioredoxin reductase
VATNLDAIIVGCGPYGLSAASYLRAAGIETRVFGEPMSFWEHHTPKGMFLRSAFRASYIGSPGGQLSLAAHLENFNLEPGEAIPKEVFVGYGKWFQGRAVPDVDRRTISKIEAGPKGLRVMTEDGQHFDATRVIVATGIARFAHRPAVFRDLPAHLLSHSIECSDPGQLAGQRVAVIGGGQSALESAALLSEAGASVEVIMRSGRIFWLRGAVGMRERLGPLGPAIFPWTDVGSPPFNQIVARPNLFRRLSDGVRTWIDRRTMRASVAGWVRPRLANVRTSHLREVRTAKLNGDRVSLKLDDSTERTVDHVVLATGFKIDLARLPFLAPALLKAITRVNGYPQLNGVLESSVPGLHFVGAPAAWSFGSLTRFVAGTDYCASTLLRSFRLPVRVPTTPIARQDHAQLRAL